MRVNHDPTMSKIANSETQSTKKSENAKTRSSDSSGSVGDAASTEISARAKEMAVAKRIAADAPDISPEKEAKIAELKQRIANKEYNIKPDAIADRMVSDHMKSHGIG